MFRHHTHCNNSVLVPDRFLAQGFHQRYYDTEMEESRSFIPKKFDYRDHAQAIGVCGACMYLFAECKVVNCRINLIRSLCELAQSSSLVHFSRNDRKALSSHLAYEVYPNIHICYMPVYAIPGIEFLAEYKFVLCQKCRAEKTLHLQKLSESESIEQLSSSAKENFNIIYWCWKVVLIMRGSFSLESEGDN